MGPRKRISLKPSHSNYLIKTFNQSIEKRGRTYLMKKGEKN